MSDTKPGRDKDICRLYRAGHSLTWIARLYCLAPTTVRRILLKCGIKLRTQSEALRHRGAIKRPRKAGHELCDVIRRYNDGETYKQISQAHGITRSAVAGMLYRARLAVSQ